MTRHIDSLNQIQYDLVIIDEAHMLKEPSSKRSKAVMGVKGLVHKTKRMWLLTGTPMPNHAGELWIILFVAGLTQYTYDQFIQKYCTYYATPYGGGRLQVTGTRMDRVHELKPLLKSISLRRLAKDVLELPPISYHEYLIKGSSDASIFKENPGLKEKLKEELSLLQSKVNFNQVIDDDKLLTALTMIAESTPSLRRYHALKKVKETVELLTDELEAGQYQKTIIFGYTRDVLGLLYDRLKKFNPVIVTGKTVDKFEQAEIFNNDDTCRIFIGNIQSAGTAITLNAASRINFIEQDWVPGNNAQAAKRCHRIGQRNHVLIRHIAVSGGIDEKITSALMRKTKQINSVLD